MYNSHNWGYFKHDTFIYQLVTFHNSLVDKTYVIVTFRETSSFLCNYTYIYTYIYMYTQFPIQSMYSHILITP